MFKEPDWLTEQKKAQEKLIEEGFEETMQAMETAREAREKKHDEVVGALREIIQLLKEIRDK